MNVRRSSPSMLATVIVLTAVVVVPSWRATPGRAWASDGGDTIADLKELSLDQLMELEIPTVYGASKHEQKITEAPASVTIVTREDIQQFGYRTLGEILQSVRGVYVTYDRAYSFIGMRGVNRPGDFGGRVLVTVDGHRINEPIYDSGLSGFEFPVDVDLIERVEVIRGPGSVLYGNNAFLGIVNVVTRTASDVGRLEMSGHAGDFETFGGRMSGAHRFGNGLEVMTSASYRDTDGQEQLRYDDPIPPARHRDGSRTRQFLGRISYGTLSLMGVYGRRTKTIAPGTYGIVLGDPRSTVEDERAFAELKYGHTFAGWATNGRLYYDHYRYVGRYFYDYAEDPDTPAVTLNREEPSASSWGGEIQASRDVLSRARVTLGIDGRHDFDLRQRSYDVEPRTTYLDTTSSRGTFGAYAQAEVTLLDDLALNAGVRLDYFTVFGITVNPRAALIYHPWPTTTLKAVYGQAYRAPNAYETDFTDFLFAANADLDPETLRSYELIAEQALGKHVRVTGTLFYSQIKDLITQAEETLNEEISYVFRNTDAVDVQGGELEIEGRWKYGIRGRASYTYARAIDDSTRDRLDNSPRHLGKLQLVAPLYPEKAFLGFEVQGLSSRRTVTERTVDGRAIGNLSLFSRPFGTPVEVSATIYNLWNTRYVDPVSDDFVTDTMPQDRRNFQIKLTYRF